MKKVLAITFLFVIALTVACFAVHEALPVYIYGYEGYSSMSGTIAALTKEAKELDIDDEDDKELIKLLENTLISLDKKCNSFEEGKDAEPVEITDEYNQLLKISKDLKLGREHILMQNLDKLIKNIEKENPEKPAEENNEGTIH